MKNNFFRLLNILIIGTLLLSVNTPAVLGGEIYTLGNQQTFLPIVQRSLPPIIPETTKVLPADTLQDLVAISESGVFTFTQGSAALDNVSIGDVIVGDVSPAAPAGFLRKVSSISTPNGAVVLVTESATLEDAIQQGSISLSKRFTPADIVSMTTIPGVTLLQPTESQFVNGFSFALKDVVLYDHDGDMNTTYDQIKANGSLDLAPGFDFDLVVKDGKLQTLDFIPTVEEKVELEFQIEVELASVELQYELARLNLGTITVLVGPFPVVFLIQMPIYAKLDGKVSVGITTTVGQQANLAAGLRYRDGNWSPVSNLTNSFTFDPPRFSASAEIKGYIDPPLGLLLYGVAGPFASFTPYLKFTVDPFATPWWTLYGGFDASVGVKVEVLGHSLGDHSEVVVAYKILLAQAQMEQANLQNYVVGQYMGTAQAVAVSGSTAYIGAGQRLDVIDISNLANPQRIGLPIVLPGTIRSIVLQAPLAYVAASEGGLYIVDISDPANLKIVGSYSLQQGQAEALASVGIYVYMAALEGGLYVIDVSTPSNPQSVTNRFQDRYVSDVVVDGDYLYFSGIDSVYSLNIQTPTALGDATLFGSGEFDEITVDGNYLYSLGYCILTAYDLTDPELPVELGSIGSCNNSQFSSLAARNGRVYIGDLSSVVVVNATNPQAMAFEDWLAMPTSFAMDWQGEFVYLATESGLVIVRDDPEGPRRIGSYHSPYFYPKQIFAQDNRLVLIGDDVRIISTLDPLHFDLLSVYQPAQSIQDADASGNFLYLVQGGLLHIVDVNDPYAPQETGIYTGTDGIAIDYVTLVGSYAYAFTQGETEILDISNPAQPSLVAKTNMYGKIVLSGNLGIEVGGSIWDLQDPTAPIKIGDLSNIGVFIDVAVNGDFAYGLTDQGFLYVIDIQDPANPIERGAYLPGYYDLYDNLCDIVGVYGNYIFISTANSSTTEIIDISQPDSPMKSGEFYFPSAIANMITISGTSYVIAGDMYTVDLSTPEQPRILGTLSNGYGYSTGVETMGDLTFARSSYGKLDLISAANPANPVRLGGTSYSNHRYVDGYGDFVVQPSTLPSYLYVGAPNFNVWKILDPTRIKLLPPDQSLLPSQLIAIDGSIVYQVPFSNKVVAIDVFDPEHPAPLGEIDFISDEIIWIQAWQGYVYVEMTDRLTTIDFRDPLHPQVVNEILLDTSRSGEFSIGDGYLYLCTSSGKFQVYSLFSPAQPALYGETDVYCRQPILHGQQVLALGGGLIVIDISDPVHPTLTETYTAGWDLSLVWNDIAISGNYIYLTAGDDGLMILTDSFLSTQAK